MPMRFVCAAAILLGGFISSIGRGAESPDKVRVLVWDERQPTQATAYDNFLGNAIADHLKKRTDFDVRSVGLQDPDQGLGGDAIDHADVIVWWGHQKQRDVKWEVGDRIVARVKAGKLGLIALHSAHWSTPFIKAMNEKTIEQATRSLTEEERKEYEVRTIVPRAYQVPKRDAKPTPYWEKKTDAQGKKILEVTLPYCVFPSYRADAQPGHMTTLLKGHPIAAGVPEKWDVAQTEMYDEPFHVPQPDEVIFEEKWDKGERFPSGCVWNIGKGKVFYFRPGHEIYPVYRQEMPLKVIENAVGWIGRDVRKN